MGIKPTVGVRTAAGSPHPRKMIRSVYKGYRETKRLNHPLAINEQKLQTMEAKYHLDIERLRQLNIR